VWFVGIFSGILSTISPFSRNYTGLVFLFTDKIYSIVCHQETAKSFFIDGNKLEVCARCTGIYSGAVIFSIAGLLFRKLRPRDKKWLLYSMIPMAADVIFYSAGIYDYSKWVAFSTGMILGSASILYIFTGIEDYFLEFNLSSHAQ
jgi:uncharacterized membrane protein